MEAKLVYTFTWDAEGQKGMALFAGPGAERVARVSEAALDLYGALKRIVLAYDDGGDAMVNIAMGALEEVESPDDWRNTPTTKTKPSP